MKISIPVITGLIRLAEFAPELGEQAFVVWLNPPSALLREYDECLARVLERQRQLPVATATEEQVGEVLAGDRPDVERMVEIVSEMLSQGPEETRVSPEDLHAMIADLEDANPTFYRWLVARVWRSVGDYRRGEKKSVPPG